MFFLSIISGSYQPSLLKSTLYCIQQFTHIHDPFATYKALARNRRVIILKNDRLLFLHCITFYSYRSEQIDTIPKDSHKLVAASENSLFYGGDSSFH